MEAECEQVVDARLMRPYVATFVERVTARNRLPLDYSVESLRVVDFVVDGLRKGAKVRSDVDGVLFALGAYVGEVLVRRAGAVWVDYDDAQQLLFGQLIGVRMPDGRVWNPLGKVVKRFEMGAGESVRELYLQLHGRRTRTRARMGPEANSVA
ncbi:hypothetical protein [Streptomyces sp. NRRL B-24720]|uniref:hypothetical protein n=1 Tax=Streptomyces sp. NRRL B-24720 TaxID=1476876 RepID=UPI00056AE33A|nr:hypothetical protein [Streptomyces sp. NRRL B-24720]